MDNTCTVCGTHKRKMRSRCCGKCKLSPPANVVVVGDPLGPHIRAEFSPDLLVLEGEETAIFIDLA